MDGNGRWANARGLPRIEGHRMGEAALMDVARGCIDIGVRWLSAYAFSTENWRRSPDEVRFLMGSTATSSAAGSTRCTRWACGCAGPGGGHGCGAA